MPDTNNQPNWEMQSTDGNGRSWQQNDLPKGARKASAPKDNYTAGSSDGAAGNGFGEYDPRSGVLDEVQSRSFLGSKNGKDTANANFENPAITRSNPVNNDIAEANRVNPHRSSVKKEWFGTVEQGLAGKE